MTGRARSGRVVALLAVSGVIVLISSVVAAVVVTRRSPPEPPPPVRPTIEPWLQEWSATRDRPSVELHVAPDGTGESCSATSPCSLTTGRDQARVRRVAQPGQRAPDVVVRLGNGTYTLGEPFVLGSDDAGEDGQRITYEAAAGATPVLSGGHHVTGWTLDDPASGIYSASVDPALDSRQFFVNGIRATRARGLDRPPGWERTAAGFLAPDDTMAAWRNPTNVEIVSHREWKAMRCPVAAINGREVTMAQPCWKNVNAADPETMVDVTRVENARELLDEPGEWYLDRTAGRLSYKPRPDEDLQTATTILPTTSTLVLMSGSIDRPVHDIAFRGITFSYNTWSSPSSTKGYPVTQAGWFLGGDTDPPNHRDVSRTEGAVSVAYVNHVRFERNSFEHLGSAAIDFQTGSQDVGVVGNSFDDIGSHGIQVGEAKIFSDRPSDERDRLDRFEIANNVVQRVGADYADAVAISVIYGSNISILHNDVMHLPYTAIAVGWGWGTDSYAKHNVVRANHVADVMRVLRDGGAVYTLSSQPETVIDRNYIHDQVNPFGALYLDEGSRNITVAENVVAKVPSWLHIWTDSIRDNTVIGNFSDTRELMNKGANIVLRGNQEGLSSWPAAAQQIIDQAGIEPAYRDIRGS